MKQLPVNSLGAIITTTTGVISWLNIFSFCGITLLSWDRYQQAILEYLPWMNIYWMFTLIALIVVSLLVIQYMIIQPSIYAFTNQQSYEHRSPFQYDLEALKQGQKKIMDKLEIKD